MKVKALALSIVISSFSTNISAAEVTGFSAGQESVQATAGNLNINSETHGLQGVFGATISSIDISMATSTDSMVETVLNTAPSSIPAKMLENYPEAPTTEDGIAAFESLTDSSLTTDAEFKTDVDNYLNDHKYSGIPLNYWLSVQLITQTAEHLILAASGEAEGSTNIYQCSTDLYVAGQPLDAQGSCTLLDTVTGLDGRALRENSNGSFESNDFVYRYSDQPFIFSTIYGYKAYIGGNLIDVDMSPDNFIAVNHRPAPDYWSVYDNRSYTGGFSFYYPSDDVLQPVNLTPFYGIAPETVFYANGTTAYYDRITPEGERVFMRATGSLPVTLGGYSERELPLKMKGINNSGFGFSDNITSLIYEVDKLFTVDIVELLGMGYFGSVDLGVYTPVIYNVADNTQTYLSSYAVRHLEETTPAGFIPAVRSAVLSSLPSALADAYPKLPSDLTGLSIDPDISEVQLAALIDEKIIRVATSGALSSFNKGESISVNGTNPETEEIRWNSNELKFTSRTSLRAPYVSYSLNDNQDYDYRFNVFAEQSELESGTGESSTFTTTASGYFTKLLTRCSATSLGGDALVELRNANSYSYAGFEASVSMSADMSSVTIEYQSESELFIDGPAMTVEANAVSGSGNVEVICSLAGTNQFGFSQASLFANELTVSAPTTISGQFASSDLELAASDIKSASVVSNTGERYGLSIAPDLSFNQAVGNTGSYTISASAAGYVLPCATQTVVAGTNNLGQLTFLKGDVTNDGAINSSDIWRYYFRYFYSSGDFDVNSDGIVNSDDLAVIRENQGAVQCDL